MNSYGNFRSNVDRALARRGWTRRRLADELGVSPSYVTQVLTGAKRPGLGVVERFAQALGSSAAGLLRPPRIKKTSDAVLQAD